MQTQVLIADDAMFMRKVIRKHLAECGMTDIVEAANGAEAVELFIKNRPGLVLMDITMPEMTGLEALEEILKTDPSQSHHVFGNRAAEHDHQVIRNGRNGIYRKTL